MSQPLTPGRMVHYRLSRGPNAGEVRPAIVVRPWSDTCAQLKVFTDEGNDGDAETFASSATMGEGPGTWSWPARV